MHCNLSDEGKAVNVVITKAKPACWVRCAFLTGVSGDFQASPSHLEDWRNIILNYTMLIDVRISNTKLTLKAFYF